MRVCHWWGNGERPAWSCPSCFHQRIKRAGWATYTRSNLLSPLRSTFCRIQEQETTLVRFHSRGTFQQCCGRSCHFAAWRSAESQRLTGCCHGTANPPGKAIAFGLGFFENLEATFIGTYSQFLFFFKKMTRKRKGPSRLSWHSSFHFRLAFKR